MTSGILHIWHACKVTHSSGTSNSKRNLKSMGSNSTPMAHALKTEYKMENNTPLDSMWMI